MVFLSVAVRWCARRRAARAASGDVLVFPGIRGGGGDGDDDEPLMAFSGEEVAPPYDPAPPYSPTHEREQIEQPPQYEYEVAAATAPPTPDDGPHPVPLGSTVPPPT